jgi:hypothetical protein
VLVYYNAADQLVLIHMGQRYCKPTQVGYPGNMLFVDFPTFEER